MSIENIMAADPFYLGDYVQESNFGRRGRISQIHSGGCPESAGWLAGQTIPFDDDEIARRHETADGEVHYWRWVSVLVEGGGAIVTTEKRLTRIEPFDLRNDYDRYYFPPDQRHSDAA